MRRFIEKFTEKPLIEEKILSIEEQAAENIRKKLFEKVSETKIDFVKPKKAQKFSEQPKKRKK